MTPRQENVDTKIERTSEAMRIGAKFVEVLEDWLDDDKMTEIASRNKNGDDSTCASHDFCDANMAMLEAFEDIQPGCEFDASDQGQADLWNSAWSHGKDLIEDEYGHECGDECRSNGCTERHKHYYE